jgi:hypothetical protein
MMNKEVNGFGQSPIEKITKRLFEAQLLNLTLYCLLFIWRIELSTTRPGK